MPIWFAVIPIMLMVAIVACSRSAETADNGYLVADALLRKTFTHHEPVFEQLLEMLREDKHLWRVGVLARGLDMEHAGTPIQDRLMEKPLGEI